MTNEYRKTTLADRQTDRVNWIDFAKGITILLTIIGHSVSSGLYGSGMRGIIFSFHMPLFFILSCITFKFSKDDLEFKKKTNIALRHLIRPAIITYVILIGSQCIHDYSLIINIEFWKGKLYTLILSSGVDVAFNGFNVAAIGMPWFFFALFLGRTIFDYIHLSLNDDRKLFVLSIVVAAIGIFWGHLQWLPFSLDIALATMPFMYYGYYLKKVSLTVSPMRKFLIYGFIWIITLYITFPDYNNWTYLELAVRRYTLFPICYITAIAGTMCISEFSVLACKLQTISKPIIYVGKNSLYLLCVHILDSMFSSLWNIENHQFLTAIKRTGVDVVVFLLFMGVRYFIMKLIKIKRKES